MDNARIVLTGGPFDGEQVATIPPDLAAPAQIVWTGWRLGAFVAWLYEWHGDRTMVDGRTDALLYHATGRRLNVEEIPPLIADGAEMWADAADLIVKAFDVPKEMIWPGL